MDNTEARALLLKELASYRRSYAELATIVGTNSVVEVRGAYGTEYTIEVDVLWDSDKQGKIRVIGSIDDGRLPGALLPLCEDLLLFPDGTFAGE